MRKAAMRVRPAGCRTNSPAMATVLSARGAPCSRAALLAGASLAALAALGSPSASAACSNVSQVVSTSTFGPILGTWDGSSSAGNITVKSSGAISGGPTGVAAANCGINALSNSGGIFGANTTTFGVAGGAGVLSNPGLTIHALNN